MLISVLPIDKMIITYTFIMARWKKIVKKSEATKQNKDQNSNRNKQTENNKNKNNNRKQTKYGRAEGKKQITNRMVW